MEPKAEELKVLKQIEKENLKAFIEICEKLNLRYYLLGGTLLGAVRHKGFIPWDDDIDVGMPRQDYEVFLEKGQELLPEHLFIQTIFTDPQYPHCFAKIRNNNTTFVESSMCNRKMNHGVYIDIFPLDYYPEDEKASRKLDRKKKYFNRRVACSFYFPEKETFKYKLVSFLMKVMFPSLNKVLRKRDALYKSAAESELLANHGGAWGKKEIVPKSWYGEGTELQFEGLTVIGPKEYDKWLTQVYGDYMQLPPEEKRVGHHYTELIDLERSYEIYIKYIK